MGRREGTHRRHLRPGAPTRRDPRRGRPSGCGRRPDRRSAAARGGDAGGAEPQRRVRGWTRRARPRHRPRALRQRPGSPAQGDAAGRPARHPRAPDAGRPGRSHRPWDRALRADAQAGWGRRGARLSRALVRGRRQDLRAGRADQPDLALLGRREPVPVPPRGRGVAPDQDARPEGRHRAGRGAARPLRGAGRRARPCLRARHAMAGRDGGLVPVRGDARPAPRHGRIQGRHGGRAADGPARRR